MNLHFLTTLATILGAEVSVLVCYMMITSSDWGIAAQRAIFVVAASAITWGATWLVENRDD